MRTHFTYLIVLVSIVYSGCQNPAKNEHTISENNTDTLPVVISPSTDSVAFKSAVSPDFNLLNGEWIREDGVYTIKISEISADGSLKAEYFNPKSIHVGKSKWEIEKYNLYLMVELQDVNYPGSLYTLQYFPKEDKLAGVYFQAMEGTKYDVAFNRKK